MKQCNFCGKTEEEVKILIQGVNVYICNECVELYIDIVKGKEEKEKQESIWKKLKCLFPKRDKC